MCMIMLIMRGEIIKKLLDNRCLSAMGRQGMAIYILHLIVYLTFAPLLFNWLKDLPYAWSFVITLSLCFALIVLLSFPTMVVINKATALTGKVILKMQDFLKSKLIAAE